MTDTRPVTSKPRGVCRYFNTSTGCLAGRTCKFLHGDEKITPFDKAKTCRFYAAGFCKRGAECWFVHERPRSQQQGSGADRKEGEEEEDEDDLCCICYEKPVTYGLLGGCSHIFCVGCIKEWRDPNGKEEDVVSSGVTKKCPLCRAPSQFVTPSSHFYPHEHPQKAVVVGQYRASMARVSCKYFERSLGNYCPFGKDCFYQHRRPDGTPHSFRHGVARSIRDRQYRDLRRQLQASESASSNHNLTGMRNEFDAIVASLRTLAASVTEVAARMPDHSPTRGERTQSGGAGETPLADADAALTRLADNIFASLMNVSMRNSGNAINPVDIHDEMQLQIGLESSLAAHRRPAGWAPATARISVRRSLPAETVDNLIAITRPSSPTNVSSRFSTLVPGRAPSPPETPVSAATAVPWTRDTHTAPPTNHESPEGQSLTEDVHAHATPDASSDNSAPSADGTPRNIHSTNTSEDTAAAQPPAVHDTDPPFMTDGRGRVVWSSATAGRGRRARVAGAGASGTVVAPSARDKPQGREQSQTESSVVRSVSESRAEEDARGA